MSALPAYIQVGSLYVQPGEKGHGYLRPLTTAGPVEIPISVVHGARPGPRLALVAGIHGSEYPGIAATMMVTRDIDPADLAGTILGVIVANVPAFRGRREKVCPLDEKNLATVFPGSPEGSPSEVIADALQREIINQADYVIELHAGDLIDELTPFTILTRTGNEEVDCKSVSLAQCYGVPALQVPTWDGRFQHRGGMYSTAAEMGKPGFVAEAGAHARLDREALDLHLRGIRAVLQYLGMVAGEPTVMPEQPITSRYVSMRSPLTGLLWSKVEPGKAVAEGEVVAEITDYFGNLQNAIRAPIKGTVVYCANSLSIQVGEALMGIADFKAGY